MFTPFLCMEGIFSKTLYYHRKLFHSLNFWAIKIAHLMEFPMSSTGGEGKQRMILCETTHFDKIALPTSWQYSSMVYGTPIWIILRMLLQSMPIPKAAVTNNTQWVDLPLTSLSTILFCSCSGYCAWYWLKSLFFATGFADDGWYCPLPICWVKYRKQSEIVSRFP